MTLEQKHPNKPNADEEGLTILSNTLKNLDRLAELDQEHGLGYGQELDTIVQHLYNMYNNKTSVNGETHGY